jgi:bacterial/archaeal transporter family-2 protein
MILTFIVVAILIGCLMPVQAGLNAELTRYLKQPYLAAFFSLTTGAMLVAILAFLNGGFSEIKKIPQMPPHLLLGGLLGAIFVGSSMYFIPRMGATAMVAAFVTGQLLGSVIIDHFGFLGLNPYPFTISRFAGVLLLLAGLALIVKKNA